MNKEGKHVTEVLGEFEFMFCVNIDCLTYDADVEEKELSHDCDVESTLAVRT